MYRYQSHRNYVVPPAFEACGDYRSVSEAAFIGTRSGYYAPILIEAEEGLRPLTEAEEHDAWKDAFGDE